MYLGTLADIIIVSFLATQGVLMEAIPFYLVGVTLIITLLYLPLVDTLKIMVFKYAHMD